MAVQQGEVQLQYSLTEMLQLRRHASSNLSLKEVGITMEPATRIVFNTPGWSTAEWQTQHQRLLGHAHRVPSGTQHAGNSRGGTGRPSSGPVGLSLAEDEQEEEWGDAEEDSEDENPQYRALHVSGEPDFSIEEPDAEEYLRRVRWEARRCPRVVVAPSLSAVPAPHQQTPYMPHLPDVAPCAPTLRPSNQWEARFLADFSDLRTDLVRLSSLVEGVDPSALSSLPSTTLPVPPLREAGAWKRFCVGPIPSSVSGEGDPGRSLRSEGGAHESGRAEGSREEEAGGPSVSGSRDQAQRSEEGGGGDSVGLVDERGAFETDAEGDAVADGRVPCEVLLVGEGAVGEAVAADGASAAVCSAVPAVSEDGRGSDGAEAVDACDAVVPQREGAAAAVVVVSAPGAVGRRARRREALPEGVLPLLGILLRFDAVAVAVHLRHHVRWLHDLSPSAPLDRTRAAWLFALCALVDKPLDADTQAALRDLVRVAAARRASKVAVDDPELPVLSVLVSIAGRYFGQQER